MHPSAERRDLLPDLQRNAMTDPGSGSCLWQEGGGSIPGTVNNFGGTSAAEYGGLQEQIYPAPGFKTQGIYETFHNTLGNNLVLRHQGEGADRLSGGRSFDWKRAAMWRPSFFQSTRRRDHHSADARPALVAAPLRLIGRVLSITPPVSTAITCTK